MRKLKPTPKFNSTQEWADFWMTHDTTEYVDWSKARRVTFPNLKPTCRSISLRLPVYMLDKLRVLANKRDVPYQSLLKTFLADRIKQETTVR
ncbi:MAG: BrnA antitoxin family protein [Candidatus Omnitrophica bacterium]|nr:BrnA antitoxin family protein [Candidatus Omnitrophota bacterium]